MTESRRFRQDQILEEVEELATRMPARELARLLEDRGHGLAAGAPGRSAWLSHAGERWQMSGDLVRAKACLEEAVVDGGGGYIDPRAELVDVLLDLGDTARADELLAELRREIAAGRVAGPVHPFVAESLELHGRLQEAHHWYSAGLTRTRREDPDNDDILCLNGRFRVRRLLGLPRDRYDELSEQRRREYAAELGHEDDLLVGGRAGERRVGLAVLYWPPAEFDRVLERWPAMAEDCGSDHHEHRTAVERRLRELHEERSDLGVGTGSVEEYLPFVQGHEGGAASSSTRAAYAAHLGYLGRVTPWPPGRNDRCWCGSGLRYKTCCGALRFPSGQPGDRG